MPKPAPGPAEGPFYADQVRPGDPYELSHGHPIYCAPSGSDSGRGVIAGALALDTDPDVDSTGAEVGFTPTPKTLRAPDLAVGGIPDRSGWAPGVPPIAIEYAGAGQDEAELRAKIDEFLKAGTRFVWVVRLVRGRRVEVHERGQPKVTKQVGDLLLAPGVLRHPVPVEALFDRNVAHDVAFRNLLERHGYGSLDEVRAESREEGRGEGREEGREVGREEGREQGREEGRRQALLAVLEARGFPADDQLQARVSLGTGATLDLWLRRAVTVEELAKLFDP